jgi:FixJ family two-component response regulator
MSDVKIALKAIQSQKPEATIFLVDDDASVRKAMAGVLTSAGYRVEVFGSACTFREQYQPTVSCCLVLGVVLPGLSGLDLQDQLAAEEHQLPIIFITHHADISMCVRAMKAGAEDFLSKPVQSDVLLRAVELALARNAEARRFWNEVKEFRDRLQTLTNREREVFALVVNGMLNKQSAARLGTTEKTIKVHRGRVMHKMGAKSLADLVRGAVKADMRGTPPPLARAVRYS